MKQWQKNREALKAKLRSLPADTFDMDIILEDYIIEDGDGVTRIVKATCGTVGCIAGHAHLMPGIGEIVFRTEEWNRLWVDTVVFADALGSNEKSINDLIENYDIKTIEQACAEIDDLPVGSEYPYDDE